METKVTDGDRKAEVAEAPIFIVDSILAADLKEIVNLNKDVECEDGLKKQINDFDDNALIKFTKELGSIKITNAELIDTFLNKEFPTTR